MRKLAERTTRKSLPCERASCKLIRGTNFKERLIVDGSANQVPPLIATCQLSAK
jgi:hypothetical protein